MAYHWSSDERGNYTTETFEHRGRANAHIPDFRRKDLGPVDVDNTVG